MISVLLVDDEPLLLEGLKLMIDWEKYGFEICGEARDGGEALEMIKANCPNVVVTDIHMPLLNGLELIEQSQESMKKPPKFIILSGYDDFSFAQTAMRLNVNNFMLKPIDDIEMDAVLHKLSCEIREEQRIEAGKELKQKLLINHSIVQMIRGESEESVIERDKSLLGINDTMDLACILMEFEDKTDVEDSHNTNAKQQLKNLIGALFNEYYPNKLICLFEDGTDRIGMIVHEDSGLSKHLEALFHEAKMQDSLPTNFRVHIYSSEKKKGIRAIKELYEQALAARKLKYYRKGILFHFSDLKNLDITDEIGEADYKQLFINMKAKDVEEVNRQISEIFLIFSTKQLAIGGVRLFISNLKMELIEKVSELNGDPDDFLSELLNFDNDFDSTNLNSMECYVLKICHFTKVYLECLTQKNLKNTIFHIVQYVNKQYNKPLKLQTVAEHYQMNPTYLGQLFKKHTGEAFNTYIHIKRIDEAKKLLIRTHMKIADVAATVGYHDPDYFVSKFKMITNCLPSSFKKLSIENETYGQEV